jgi:predicted metal-dependent TIM-barrel fold hydrolase
LEGSFLSRPINSNKVKMERIGQVDGLPLFDNEEEARRYGIENYGCVGVHQHKPGEFMPCESHDVLMNSINNLYKNNDEVFIDEIRNIINKTNLYSNE